MKNASKNVLLNAALKRWREKHPSLVKKTVLSWIEDGLVSCVLEPHGHTEWHTFAPKEVERVYKLLRADAKLGEAVLPRK